MVIIITVILDNLNMFMYWNFGLVWSGDIDQPFIHLASSIYHDKIRWVSTYLVILCWIVPLACLLPSLFEAYGKVIMVMI